MQARIDAQDDAAPTTCCAPIGASHREVIEGFVIPSARASRDVQTAGLWTGLDRALRNAHPCDGTGD